jgi:hypothetical protein
MRSFADAKPPAANPVDRFNLDDSQTISDG